MSFSRSQSNGKGGTGGFGQGNAPPPEAPESATGTERKQLQGALHEGQIIGSFLVKGMPPKGEAAKEYRQVMLSGARRAEQTIEQERIPADLKEIPKRYFERIQGED